MPPSYEVSIMHLPLSGSCLPLQISLVAATKTVPPMCLVVREQDAKPNTQCPVCVEVRDTGTVNDTLELQYLTLHHLFVGPPRGPPPSEEIMTNLFGRLVQNCSLSCYTSVQSASQKMRLNSIFMPWTCPIGRLIQWGMGAPRVGYETQALAACRFHWGGRSPQHSRLQRLDHHPSH
jgi:hypothetical protein